MGVKVNSSLQKAVMALTICEYCNFYQKLCNAFKREQTHLCIMKF
jgi:hypothetical protein